MQDEHPHLIAECARCHFRFDILLGTDCPNCRMIAVQTTFRPRNPEDYAKLDFLRSKLAEQGVRWHGEEPSYLRGERLVEPWNSAPDIPAECKVPLGEAAQIYELRRLCRL